MATYTNQPLKLGANGRPVVFLQARLGVPLSGDFDVETESVLKTRQRATGNQPDGVYGPMTNAALTMMQQSKPGGVATSLGIDVAALKALLAVETVGRGFYMNGLPKLLLERHYVYKLATEAQRAQLPATVCNAEAGGYIGNLGEWSRFDQVAAVSLDLAIRSCSWGIAQVMGIQCAKLSMSPTQFMMRHVTNEDDQLALFGDYIASNAPLHAALKAHDWPEVARLYNGENYAQNNYDKKLANAYATWAATPTS